MMMLKRIIATAVSAAVVFGLTSCAQPQGVFSDESDTGTLYETQSGTQSEDDTVRVPDAETVRPTSTASTAANDGAVNGGREDGERKDTPAQTVSPDAPVKTDTGGSIRRAYRDYFYARFDDSDKVYLADVTHDGRDEMLVVDIEADGEAAIIRGHVYRADGDEIIEIYNNEGGTCHAANYFGWYLCESGNGYNLLEESFGMWQGRGKLNLTEYTLDDNGNKSVVDEIVLSSNDPQSQDSDGRVTEAALKAYQEKISLRLSDCFSLHKYDTESDGNCKNLNTSPSAVFAG